MHGAVLDRLKIPDFSFESGAMPHDETTLPMRYKLQAIATPAGQIHGYELLYRGSLRTGWEEIDKAVFRFLGMKTFHGKKIFLNISNESLLTLDDEEFLRVASKNDVVFELSEAFSSAQSPEMIAEKVNALTKAGLTFALDDFGNGRDGLLRLYSLSRVAYIKVDGLFLRQCMMRDDAGLALQSLIEQWKRQQIKIVAEWVESEDMLRQVEQWGFDLAQGWHIDKVYGYGKKSKSAHAAVLDKAL